MRRKLDPMFILFGSFAFVAFAIAAMIAAAWRLKLH